MRRRARVLLAAYAIVGLGFISACGQATPVVVETPPRLSAIRHTTAGPRVAALARPTPEVVWVSMWIDAGSRDAEVPQIATMAAELAARKAGGAVPLVVPDGISIAKLCWRNELRSCLEALERGLAFRSPSAVAVQNARLRLTQDRRRALARRPARRLRRATLQALFGPASNGFLPLGRAEDDHRATRAAVAKFLRTHFGVQRSLIVGVGDIDVGQLESEINAVFSRGPKATGRFVSRSLPGQTRGRAPLPLAVEVGEDSNALVVAALPAGRRGLVEAAGLRRYLSARGLASSTPVSETLAVRGGLLAFYDLADSEPQRVVQLVATYDAERQSASGSAPRGKQEIRRGSPLAADSDGSLRDTATRLGIRWCARGRHRRVQRVAIGALIKGGRSDHTELSDPDASLRRQTRALLVRAYDRARAPLTWTRYKGDASRVSSQLDNGARIENRRRGTERAAIAVRVGIGGDSDPASAHGRAALLAHIAARNCDGVTASALTTTLTTLGATLSPVVDPESWGLVIQLPNERWRAGLALALRCTLRPSLVRQHVVDTRADLRGQLVDAEPKSSMAANAGGLLSPGAPGWIAPLGDRQSLIGVSHQDLQALRDAIRGGSIAVAVVADANAEKVAEAAGRRLRHLPKSEARGVRLPAGASDGDAGEHTGQPFHYAVIGWRAGPAPGGRAGAQALSLLARGVLDGLPGARVVWAQGSADHRGSWAAVGLVVLPERSQSLLPRMKRRLAKLDASLLGPVVEPTWSALARATLAASASVRSHANRLARRAWTGALKPTRGAAMHAARQLLRTRPRVSVWR